MSKLSYNIFSNHMNIPGIGNLGDIGKMRAIQDALKQQEVVHEYNGVKVTVRGDMHLQEIVIDGIVENRVLTALNEAFQKVQKQATQELMKMK